MLADGGGQRIELGRGADLGIQLLVILDVVAVRRSGRGLHHGGGVQIGDPELGEVPRDLRRLTKPESLVQLHAIGRDRLGNARQLGCHFVEQRAGTRLDRRCPELAFLAHPGLPGRRCDLAHSPVPLGKMRQEARGGYRLGSGL